MSSVAETPAAPEAERPTARDLVRRFVEGDLASLRVVLVLAVIWIIFQSQNDRFLSAENLTNLMPVSYTHLTLPTTPYV